MKLMVVFALSALLTGCASLYEEKVVRISLSPELASISAETTLSGASPVSLEVVDRRDWKAPGLSRKWGRLQVGLGRNPFGEQIEPTVVVTEPVDVTLKRLVAERIKLMGGEVGQDQCLLLKLDLDKFFNDFEVINRVLVITKTAVAELHMVATVQSARGDVLYRRDISTRSDVHVGLSTSEIDATRTALNSAMAKGITALMGEPELLAVIRRTPACPRPRP